MAKTDINPIFKTHSGRQKPRQRHEKIKQDERKLIERIKKPQQTTLV